MPDPLSLAAVAVAMLALAACQPARAEQPASRAQLGEQPVGQAILDGYRRYNSACNHCHGPDGIGSSFAPSLIDRPLPYARFREIVEQGSATGVSVMRGFAKTRATALSKSWRESRTIGFSHAGTGANESAPARTRNVASVVAVPHGDRGRRLRSSVIGADWSAARRMPQVCDLRTKKQDTDHIATTCRPRCAPPHVDER